MRGTKLRAVVAAGAALALLAADGAAADNYQYRFTSTDQAAARRAVLLRTDLPTLSTWKGGFVKPDESADDTSCHGYSPKLSDLVVTGDSETKYESNGFTIDTQATVLRTKTMVETDWRRQPRSSDVLQCFREQWSAIGTSGSHFVSAAKLAPTELGTHATGYEVVFSVSAGAGKQPVRVAMDMVGFTRGRTEVMVIASAPVASTDGAAIVKAAATRVASIIDAKLRA
jgi:hypothetical protein